VSTKDDRPSAYVFTRDRWHVRAGEWAVYAVAWIFLAVTRPFGVWTLSRVLAPLGGWAVLAVPAFRKRAQQNLAQVWPERGAAAHRAIAMEAGRQFLRLLIEYPRLTRFSQKMVLCSEGLEHLKSVRAQGRGAILATAHYGNWEAVRIAALRAGIDSGIIYRAFNNRYLDRTAFETIHCAGTPVLRKGAAGLRAMIAHLKRGGVVMILVDQRNSGAPMLPFLGQPAETVLAAAELAKRCNAALIPAVGRRNVAERRFEVSFEPEIPVDDPAAAMTEVNARIGAWIEADPGQWLWFHRRWKTARRGR